jgi:hypothetical protein
MMCLILRLRQNRLQSGYVAFAQALPWVHAKLGTLDVDDCEDMLKKVSAFNRFALHTHSL